MTSELALPPNMAWRVLAERRILDEEMRVADLPAFWADATLANNELDWRVTRGIDAMMRDTWNWQSKNPNGYTL